MKRHSKLLAACFVLLAFPVGAHAATLNFATEAAVGGERGLENGGLFTSSNGYTVRLTSGGTASDGSAVVPAPFLDGEFDGRPGGLGVCTLEAGPGSECGFSNEDNVTGDQSEFIEIGFVDDVGARLFSLGGISFRDKDHFDISSSDDLIQVALDGGASLTTTFAAVVAAAAAGDYASAETLRLTAVSIANGGREFYVNSISNVPIPGALPLLLSGLAALGFAGRRKKVSQ